MELESRVDRQAAVASAAAAAGREAALEVRRRKKGERQALVRQLVDAAVPQMQLHVELKERFGVKASSRTVRDDVKELGYGQRLARRHPARCLRICEREGCHNFHAPTGYSVAQGWGKFCSRDCHYASRYVAEPEERVCARKGCKVRFTPYPSEAVRPGHGQFCSDRCRGLAWWDCEDNVAALVASLESRGLFKGRARQRWIAAWKAKRAGRVGGKRPVEELYPERAKNALALKGKKTLRDIADDTGLTKREVEGIFARAARLSP